MKETPLTDPLQIYAESPIQIEKKASSVVVRIRFDQMASVHTRLHSLPAEFVSMTPHFMEPRLKFRLPNGHYMTFFCGNIFESTYKADFEDPATGDVYKITHLNPAFPVGEEVPLGYVELSHRYGDTSVQSCIKFRHPLLGLRAATVTELIVHVDETVRI